MEGVVEVTKRMISLYSLELHETNLVKYISNNNNNLVLFPLFTPKRDPRYPQNNDWNTIQQHE